MNSLLYLLWSLSVNLHLQQSTSGKESWNNKAREIRRNQNKNWRELWNMKKDPVTQQNSYMFGDLRRHHPLVSLPHGSHVNVQAAPLEDLLFSMHHSAWRQTALQGSCQLSVNSSVSANPPKAHRNEITVNKPKPVQVCFQISSVLGCFLPYSLPPRPGVLKAVTLSSNRRESSISQRLEKAKDKKGRSQSFHFLQ